MNTNVIASSSRSHIANNRHCSASNNHERCQQILINMLVNTSENEMHNSIEITTINDRINEMNEILIYVVLIIQEMPKLKYSWLLFTV